MKLGTIVFEEEIYNLDYMNAKEIEELLKVTANKRKEYMQQGKKLLIQEK